MTSGYNRKVFGERLRALLEEQEMSEADLAERVGIGQQAVSKWVTGTTLPRPSRMGAVANALNVAPAALIEAWVSAAPAPESSSGREPKRTLAERVSELERRVSSLEEARRPRRGQPPRAPA